MWGFGGNFYWGRRERGKVEGIVVVFAWMSSQEKHLKNYIDIYASLGWNSLVCHSQFLNLIQNMSRSKSTTPDYYSKSKVIVNVNQFQALDNNPPLSYARAIQIPTQRPQMINEESSSKPTQETGTQITLLKNGYFLKPEVEHIMPTNFSVAQNLSTLTNITQKCFPNECNWFTPESLKNQIFYEYILVDSKSVEITHTMDTKDPNKIAYSKCVIKRVVRFEEVSKPYSLNPFSQNFEPKGYNYFDYKDAWSRAFLKRSFDHSWFFIFHHDFINTSIPLWFQDWWYVFGPLPEILPPAIKEARKLYIYRSSHEPFNKDLMFHAEFKVPWILCWSYSFKQVRPKPCSVSIVREFKIKWWQNYSEKYCNQEIVQTFFNTGVKPKWDFPSTPTLSSQKSPKNTQTSGTSPVKTQFGYDICYSPPQKTSQKISRKTSSKKKVELSSDSDSGLSAKDKKLFQTLAKEFLKAKKMSESEKEDIYSSSHHDYDDVFGGPCAQGD